MPVCASPLSAGSDHETCPGPWDMEFTKQKISWETFLEIKCILYTYNIGTVWKLVLNWFEFQNEYALNINNFLMSGNIQPRILFSVKLYGCSKIIQIRSQIFNQPECQVTFTALYFSLSPFKWTEFHRTVAASGELTCLCSLASASASPLPLSSNCQRMTGAWMNL